ncbi:MAG: endolytic transglycosylase MltG [Nitriliruptorales bacterium]
MSRSVAPASGPRVVLIILIVALVVVAAGLATVAWAMSGEPGAGEPVTIEVDRGASASAVAGELEERGVVRSALAFRLKAQSRGLDRELRAGRYQLETGLSVDETIDRLLSGPDQPMAIRFTIPEGLTVGETLERLAAQTPYAVEDYRAVLDARAIELPDWVATPSSGAREPYEGLLFPETYEERPGAPPQAILQRMVGQLEKVVSSLPDEVVAGAVARGQDRYQALIIASLVEEEAKIPQERPTIAGVIYNRLAAGRSLEIDASVIYALGTHTNRVTIQDLQVDSPYNLYRNPGLPPTPIAAPGAASIRAAFQPAQHDFLYYVRIDEAGRHVFSRTFEEHKRNKARYRQLQDAVPSSPDVGS